MPKVVKIYIACLPISGSHGHERPVTEYKLTQDKDGEDPNLE